MMNIVFAVIIMGALAIVFGAVLAVAAKKFAVEVDPRQEAIAEVLPGANCGGCGFPGCGGYAAAVVKGEAPVNSCAAGGSEVAAKIGEIMGVDAGGAERSIALVRCTGYNSITKRKFEYSGISDCQAAIRFGGGSGANECQNGCLGFGTCVAACPFGAMEMIDGVAHVDRKKCVGCMKCASVCPKNLIVKVPYDADVVVPCASTQKGAAVRKACEIGCVGCKICEKTCDYDAIHVVDNVAVIDYDKCITCGMCALKCPRKLIHNINDGELVVVPSAVAAKQA